MIRLEDGNSFAGVCDLEKKFFIIIIQINSEKK